MTDPTNSSEFSSSAPPPPPATIASSEPLPDSALGPDATTPLADVVPVQLAPVELAAADVSRAPELEAPPIDATWAAASASRAFVRERVWPALVAGVAVIPMAAIISGIVMALLLLAQNGPQVLQNQAQFQQAMREFITTRLGLLAMIAPGQMVFSIVAAAGATLSPLPWRERLGLVRGHWPVWTWPILALGTPMIAFLTSLVLSQLVETKSANLQMLENLFRAEDPVTLAMLYLLIGCLPGIGEELIYRGYVQQRLAKSWAPQWAIGLSALIFAVAHLDPIHSLGVLPLGLWLGTIAWKTGSIWPAMLAHAANNSIAIMMTRWGEVDQHDTPALAARGLVILLLGGALTTSVVLLLSFPNRQESAVHV